jgi:hypothetical protein
MPEYKVLDHHLDGDTYRLTVGIVEERNVVARDDRGEIVYDGSDDAGPLPKTETQEVVVWQEEFVFAADDERWKDKADKTVAKRQRDAVLEVLQERDQEREAAERRRTTAQRLPGVGESL